MQSNFDINGLIKALSSEDKLIRRRAAAALRLIGSPDALPALKQAHEKEDDPQTGLIMAAAIETLSLPAESSETSRSSQVGSNVAEDDASAEVQRLIDIVRSDDGDAIIEAATTLGEMGEKLAVEALIVAFNNQKHSIHVRLAIAESLLKLESAPVEVALLANLRHPDWHIRRNGAAILGQLQAEWAIQPLARSLTDPHPIVRRTSLAALKHIGTPESRKALAQFSPTSQQNPAANVQETRAEVSGIEVKRPGKQIEEIEDSSLLKRLRKHQEAVERARRGTQPLDEDAIKEYQKRIEATRPISDDLLDTLDALLDEKNKKADEESSEE